MSTEGQDGFGEEDYLKALDQLHKKPKQPDGTSDENSSDTEGG